MESIILICKITNFKNKTNKFKYIYLWLKTRRNKESKMPEHLIFYQNNLLNYIKKEKYI